MSTPNWKLLGAAAALAVAGWTAPGVAVAAGYAVFAVPQAVAGTYPTARNTNGDVTGLYLDAALAAHGFVRQASGEIVTFDFPGGLPQLNTRPVAISDDGTVSGYYGYSTTTAPGYVVQGFRRAPDGTFTSFAVPDTSATFVTAGNRNGVLTGYVYYSPSSTIKGYVRSGTGDTTVFGGGADQQWVPATINDVGDVAGYVNYVQGFVRLADGTIDLFDVPASPATPGQPEVLVLGINNQGAVVGWADNTYCPSLACVSINLRGFVRQRDGRLDTFQVRGQPTEANAINGAGAVTGTYYQPGGPYGGVAHGFVRSPQGVVARFQVPQMKQTYGVLIGDDGVVLGRCTDAAGKVWGFLRTP